jgi:hypothetical protein
MADDAKRKARAEVKAQAKFERIGDAHEEARKARR